MSDTTVKFYNIFWQNKACQNLFLLSKEEFLDRDVIESINGTLIVPYPRIILSNNLDSEFNKKKIQLRRSNTKVDLNTNLDFIGNNSISLLETLDLEKIKKEITNSLQVIEEKPIRFVLTMLSAISSGNDDRVFKALKDYKLIKPHIESWDQLEKFYKNLFEKYYKKLFTDSTVRNFNEALRIVKDQYTNYLYQRLIESNQITVNALLEVDNFQSRLELFEFLYEAGVISASDEDSFLECRECDPGTFNGSMKIKLKPNNTKNLICPSCGKQLIYFIPYCLKAEIFEIVNSKDGLLLHALINFLTSRGISYKANAYYAKKIEIDCAFEFDNYLYLVEVKMFKTENTTAQKIKQKVKKALKKLQEDVEEISALEVGLKPISPILLVNIHNTSIIEEIVQEVSDSPIGTIPIMQLEDFTSHIIHASANKSLIY